MVCVILAMACSTVCWEEQTFAPGKLGIVWDVRVPGDDWSATHIVAFLGNLVVMMF